MMRAPTVRGFQRTPSAGIFNRGRFSPLRLPNLAAWYDLGPTRQASTTSNDIRIDASNRVSLIADRSGNSGTNCLCLNGAVGNYASAPDSAALSITGDLDLRARVALNDWTPATDQSIIAKWNTTGNQRSYYLYVLATTGRLILTWSTDGTSGSAPFASSTVSPTVSDLGELWIRATLDVDNGAGGRTVTFFTSADGVTWSQLGAAVTAAGTTSVFDSTAPVEIGSIVVGTSTPTTGRVYRAQIYNGINGTLAFDANFALAGKLVSSFTESSSNAATVTINSSGDLGARISGERDLVQLTASKQPIYTAATATTPAFITFDGTDDYMKAAAFSLSQPTSVYFVGQQPSWGAARVYHDGGTLNSININTRTATPNICMFAGSFAADNTGFAVGVRALVSSVWNAASSSLRVNRGAATTGNPGTTAANGFTVGASASPLNYGNITTNEVAIYAAAHDTATQDRFALYAASKWRISGV